MSFCFTAGAALFIQIVLLPHLIPRLHAGHGLLVGGDWVGFHEMAVSQAQAISQHGWGRWKLRPAGHAQVGVASVFYTILVAEPWVLIPLNACLHAVATVLLARMLWMITGHRSISIVAALPFLLYPTSAAWYSQLHKEGYFIAGYFLCLFGWMRIAQLRGAHLPRGFLLASILVILAGTLTVGLVRDFGVKLVAVMGFFFAVILTIRLLVTHTKTLNWNTALTILLFLAIPSATKEYSSNHYFDAAQITSQITLQPSAGLHDVQLAPLSSIWTNSLGLPGQIDAQFAAISQIRRDYIGSGSGRGATAVDSDVRFADVTDFLEYLPRAIQIGLLAPFPQDWVVDGSLPSSAAMRKVTGAEMLIAYVAYCFIPYILWRQRRNLSMWMFFQINILFVLLYTYTVPNVGTLYRMRYGFFMAVVALGVAGAVFAVQDFLLAKRADKFK